MKNLAVAAGILTLTALTWFEFPGHTWLQQDTQIYAPILEHLRDPTVLRRDLLVERPHVSFTLYDESARVLSRLTGLGFREVLEAEQIATRALGIWGLYLMASALGFSAAPALLVAGIISLGAAIAGPAVLSVEIEPDPRGFAVPLIFLAIGCLAHDREFAAGVAASAAFLMHPPTVAPFWAVYAILVCIGIVSANRAARVSKRLTSFGDTIPAIARRSSRAFIPLAAAAIILAVAARFQEGAHEAQLFFARIPPALEALQRMRAPYSWISEWWREWLPHYLVLYWLSLLAYWRVRERVPGDLRYFLAGMPLLGILSVPASYLLLEKLKWLLLPQWQPMRALLFVTVMVQFCGAAAGLIAAQSRRYLEAFAWFALIYLIPLNTTVVRLPPWNRAAAALLLAGGAVLACWAEERRFRWGAAAVAIVAGAAFLLVPELGKVRTHPQLHTPELEQLSDWARHSTPSDAMFLFADAGKGLQPGIFRTEALRAIYADWKGGGQINYLTDLGEQWWARWQQVGEAKFDAARAGKYQGMGIDYIVLSPPNRQPAPAAFENSRYLVYNTAGFSEPQP